MTKRAERLVARLGKRAGELADGDALDEVIGGSIPHLHSSTRFASGFARACSSAMARHPQ